MMVTRASLLRRYRFSENSLVVVWLTERHGKVKTAVRSATKQGSPFAGRLELFTKAEIAFKEPRSGDLHVLNEVMVEGNHTLPATYTTILCASYFAELCDLFTEPMHAVPEIFFLLERAWGFLQQQAPSKRGLEHFETEMARHLGIHDPSIPAVHSLSSVAHKLPATRSRLMEHLLGSS